MKVPSKKKMEIEERRKTVAANLAAGLNYRDISEALGVSIGTVANDSKIIFDRMRKEQVIDAERAATLELHRIDRLINSVWKTGLDGNLAAIDRLLALSDRRAKIIGFYAPVKQAITGADGGPIKTEDVGLTHEQRTSRIIALLETARDRRTGLPDEREQ